MALLWCLGLGMQVSQPGLAQAAETHPLTPEDLWAVKRLDAPSLSPDDRWAVVSVGSYDIKENSGSADLWLFSTTGEKARQLTSHPARDGNPVWSPDGRWIAFTSKREGDEDNQIYIISPTGGEARRVTRMATGVSGLRWFPDSHRLAFISWVWPDLRTEEEQAKRLKERKESKVKALVIDSTAYRYWDHWLADGRQAHLFAADLDTGACRDLLAGTRLGLFAWDLPAGLSNDLYDVAPDGQEMVFATDLSPDPGFAPNIDLVILRLADGTWENLTKDNLAGDTSPRYSPDGKWIAFTRQLTRNFYADRKRITLHDRSSRQNRVLTEGWDRSADAPAWAPDGRFLYFTAEDQGRQPLFRLGLEGGIPKRMVADGTLAGFALKARGNGVVYSRSTFRSPPALFYCGFEDSTLLPMEMMNEELVAQWRLGEVKQMRFPGFNQEPVQMWVIYPPDFRPDRKWPLLQMVHGGPHNPWADQFQFRWNAQVFAGQGYVVAAVNYHGSSSWGAQFTDSITGDYGRRELEDIEKATDHLIAQGYIDEKRLTAAGGSYGGYMMAWINGHTNRYRALVCHAGVYDWTSQMASDVVRGRERALGGFPWENPMRSLAQSAHYYAKNFKTPTLVIHGEQDYRVPVAQGFEYFNTLRMLQVPSRLVYFPDENHWILKPQNSLLWYGEVLAWLKQYAPPNP